MSLNSTIPLSKKIPPMRYWKAAPRRIAAWAHPEPTPRALPLRTSCMSGTLSSVSKRAMDCRSRPKAATVRNCSNVSEAVCPAATREALAFSERARAFVAARVGAARLLVRESKALADRRRKLRAEGIIADDNEEEEASEGMEGGGSEARELRRLGAVLRGMSEAEVLEVLQEMPSLTLAELADEALAEWRKFFCAGVE